MSKLISRALATTVVGALSLGLLGVAAADQLALPSYTAGQQATPLPPPPRYADVSHTIRRGEVMGVLLPRYGVSDVNGVIEAAKEHVNLTRVRAGKQLVFHYKRDVDQAIGVSYALDEDRTLRVDLTGDTPKAEVIEISYDTELTTRHLTLTSTLWEAALRAGLRPGDVMRLAGIFQWELDFNTELQPDATFTIVGDDLILDGTPVRPGEFHAVRLINGGKEYTAFRFVDSTDREGWYHADGKASKKAFLRSPLEFGRVTSSFNRKRFHPILKKRRPHLGTDFGAATGTPVRAVGDGVIVIAGTSGGHGKRVRIDHAGPYHTSYSHLSRIKVKNGQRVKQGDIIGLVGSTGMSTGPHLHYEVTVNGKQVDAMRVKFPTSEPLPSSELEAFAAVRDKWMPLLDAAAPVAREPESEDALVEAD